MWERHGCPLCTRGPGELTGREKGRHGLGLLLTGNPDIERALSHAWGEQDRDLGRAGLREGGRGWEGGRVPVKAWCNVTAHQMPGHFSSFPSPGTRAWSTKPWRQWPQASPGVGGWGLPPGWAGRAAGRRLVRRRATRAPGSLSPERRVCPEAQRGCQRLPDPQRVPGRQRGAPEGANGRNRPKSVKPGNELDL